MYSIECLTKCSPTWKSTSNAELAQATPSGHQLLVRAIPAWHDDEKGADRGATAIFVIDVDGVRIVHCGDLGQSKLANDQRISLGRVDVLLIPVGGVYTVDGQTAAEIVRQVNPRITIPIHYKTPALAFDLHGVNAFVDAMKPDAEVSHLPGNTLAVSASKSNGPEKTRLIVLGYEPWQPSGELAELYDRKEAASRNSAGVFRTLSSHQMNFRPSDGTHTPRWNAEHMMGRELHFFTQIFAQRDPAIAPIDLNPAQMPPDYKAAHPDWSGAEEARQIERVSASYVVAVTCSMESTSTSVRRTAAGRFADCFSRWSGTTASTRRTSKRSLICRTGRKIRPFENNARHPSLPWNSIRPGPRRLAEQRGGTAV